MIEFIIPLNLPVRAVAVRNDGGPPSGFSRDGSLAGVLRGTAVSREAPPVIEEISSNAGAAGSTDSFGRGN